MATSSDNFEFLFTVVANDSIPVSKYRSKETGISVFVAQVEGPLVNGYFCLATEAHDDDGLPHTLEHHIFMGSEQYPYKGVLDLLANRCLASGTNAWTDTDHTCYTMTNAGSEGFLKLLPVYIDHILYPTLKESGYITEVHHVNDEGEDAGVVYCEMQARENTGESLTHLAMLREMYPGHCGYKSETGGMLLNLRESTSYPKVCSYHKEFYRPENLCLIITGQVTPDKIFAALKPVEDRIVAKGSRPTFTRPWQSDVPSLDSTVHRNIPYPSDEEKHGMVRVAWRGPKAKEQYKMMSIGVLLNYLCDSAISPLQREFVEIPDPYCSKISDSMIENQKSCIYLMFQNVPVDKLEQIDGKLKNVLRKLGSREEKIDMKRLQSLIHRSVLESLNNVEDQPHDTMAFILIGDFLYGDNKDDLDIRVNSINNYKKMKDETEDFWVELLNTYFVDKPTVTVIGMPSKSLMEDMGKMEKERVAEQRKKLGEDGLCNLGKLLEKATKENEIEPPEDLLTSVTVPDVGSIQFHPIIPAANHSKEAANKVPEFPLAEIPFMFQLDHIHTNFVQIVALLDSSTVPQKLKYYLPLFCEVLLESPILRDGKLVSHEEVIAQLEADTLSSSVGLGVRGGKFSCGSFPQVASVELKVEEDRYNQGVTWLKELLYQTQFTADRLKIIVNRMTNDIAAYKRSGYRVIRTVINEILYKKNCNSVVASIIRQQNFLTQLSKTLETDPNKVLKDIESLRTMLAMPNNVRIHMSADVKKLAKQNPLLPWKQFLDSKDCGDSNSCVEKTSTYIQSYEESCNKCLLVGVGSVESAFFIQVVPCECDFHHADLPAIMVFIQYMTQLEGPMWRQIRGLGLAYSYSMYVKPETGLLYFVLSKSTHVVNAYKEGRDIVLGYINGSNELSEVDLESARSSLIFEIIEQEKTVSDVCMESMLSYFRQVDLNYNKSMLEKVSKVTIADLKRVGSQYIASLFDPEKFRCAVCVNPSKVDEVVKEFKEVSVHLTVLPSLEDNFLSEYDV
ncbi:uncharacterized protein C05D11.1-like [Haliotis asinina]|uniref:uncharacterized protein C05D11.1-like n=1 Tax=Haliotis asinina TaxID=109174 RepID=UPI003531DE6A